MSQPTICRWATPAEVESLGLPPASFRLPGGGVMLAEGTEAWLAFRADEDECELTACHADAGPWADLVERVLAQARKSKRRSARLLSEPTETLAETLRSKGFTGDPLSRALLCDAPEALQPYLDWKGRVSQIAFGKGSETINAQLYARVAAQLPDTGRFSESEINKVLNELHTYEDQSGLRRELVDRGFLARTRDCREYWKASTQA